MDGSGAAAAASGGGGAALAPSAGAGAGASPSVSPSPSPSPSSSPCPSEPSPTPGDGPGSSTEATAVEAVAGAPAAADAALSGPEGSLPLSPPPPCDSGCQDLPRDEVEVERKLPQGDGLEQKTRKIKQIVEEAVSVESRQAVVKILDEVNQLSMVEKLYLYLKLPTGKAAPVDPLRQPLNPLGSRFEIQQTITWIKTHLEEDSEVSLPKQDVYDEYLEYCTHNKMKPLSNADFGKVMKQVFPCVRPRRLGTRGNSRYCYSGMRKRMILQPPLLPDLGEHKFSPSHSEDEVVTAASCLIREWAEKLLSVKFDSLRDLACHLVEKMCVDSRSVAAFTLLSVTGGKCNGKESTSPLGLPSVPPGGTNKHLETQIQLQRKLKEREMIREQKRKLQDQQQQQTAALSKGFEKLKPSKRAKLGNLKERRLASTLAPEPGIISTINSNALDSSLTHWESHKLKEGAIGKPSALGLRGKSASVDSITTTTTTKDTIQLRQVMTASVPVMSSKHAGEKRENVEDAFVPVQSPAHLSVSHPSLNCIPDKLPIPRIVNNSAKANISKGTKADLITLPHQKISLVLRKKVYKPIQPKPETIEVKSKESTEIQIAEHKELVVEEGSVTTELCMAGAVKLEGELGQQGVTSSVKLENDSMSDYFHGGHNSQEQEEELMRYFQHQTSSSSNEELEDSLVPRRSATADPTKSDQLSQLRILLERNLSNTTAPPSAGVGVQRAPLPCCSASVLMSQSLLDDPVTNDDVFLSNSVVTIPPGASASASLSLLSQRSQQKKQKALPQPTLPLQITTSSSISSTSLPQKPELLPSLLTSNPSGSSLSVRRRVSFETSVMEHYHNDSFQNTVPPSPNTRRKFFNFTPISAGPHSPLGQRLSAPSSKPSSANASPFVSPRNTPIPRNRHSTSFPPVQLTFSQLGGRARGPSNKVVRSNSVSSGLSYNQFQPMRPRPLSTTAPLLQAIHNDGSSQSDIHSLQGINFSQNTLDSLRELSSLHREMQLPLSQSTASSLSLSAPQSPMVSSQISIAPRSTLADETSEYVNSDFLLNDMMNHSKEAQHCSNGVDSSFFPDANSHLQLPLQQNQQQIPLPTPDPLAHEVSQFFPDDVADKTSSVQQQQQQQQFQYRSQSVPLHRMISTDLMSPHYSMPQSVDTNFHFNNFSISAASSVAPTPVPSECMDFTSITDSTTGAPAANLIIDGTDPETGLNSENLDRIFNILDDVQEQQKKEEQEKQKRQREEQHQQKQQHPHHHRNIQELHHQNIHHQHPTLSHHKMQLQQDTSQHRDQEHQQHHLQQRLQQLQHRSHQQEHLHYQQQKQKTQLQQLQREQPHEIGLTLDLVAADNTSAGFLDLPGHIRPIIQSSRSYPNTPVPSKNINKRDLIVTSFSISTDTLENSPTVNGSRSLPPTPLLSIVDEATPFQSIVDRDPMLTLNALNSHLSDDPSSYISRRNMNSLIEESLTLDTLDLQDCDGFSQLTEVESTVTDT